MNIRWIGAALIIAGCAGFGFSLAAAYRKETEIVRQIVSALTYMESELTYRLTPLPELCRNTAKQCSGVIRRIFSNLSTELEQQICPDGACCMGAAMANAPQLPPRVRMILSDLGNTLGVFDLPGQIMGLQECKRRCMQELEDMHIHQDNRLRSYRMLGLCAGAALAIILL